mmetsp:Transcript_4099/g.8266  ORF Transcript_4099/g.8266 Transcript_4099/m.8266 type:complete len:213 (+) Transcript_4099:398-1036(+)
MRTNRGDAHGGTRNGEIIGQTANLACFPRDFHFFLGVSIFLKLVNMGNHVKGQGMRKDFVFHLFPVQQGSGAFLQFIHTGLSGPTGGLVCRHDDFFQSKEFVEGPQGHETNGCGTIGIGNQLGLFGFFSINLGYNQGNILVVTKCRRIVNANGSIITFGNRLGMFQGKVPRNGQKDDIAFACLFHVKEFDRHVPVLFRFNLVARTAFTTKNA